MNFGLDDQHSFPLGKRLGICCGCFCFLWLQGEVTFKVYERFCRCLQPLMSLDLLQQYLAFCRYVGAFTKLLLTYCWGLTLWCLPAVMVR